MAVKTIDWVYMVDFYWGLTIAWKDGFGMFWSQPKGLSNNSMKKCNTRLTRQTCWTNKHIGKGKNAISCEHLKTTTLWHVVNCLTSTMQTYCLTTFESKSNGSQLQQQWTTTAERLFIVIWSFKSRSLQRGSDFLKQLAAELSRFAMTGGVRGVLGLEWLCTRF